MNVLLVVYTIQTTMITSSSANNEFINLIKIGDNKMETIDKAKLLIYQAVELYLTGCVIDRHSIPEEAEVTEGTGLSFSDLVHPSGNNVSDMLDELFDGNWDDEATELQRYECKVYAEIYAAICSVNIGGEWDYYWSNEEIAPYSRCPGAWVVAKITEE